VWYFFFPFSTTKGQKSEDIKKYKVGGIEGFCFSNSTTRAACEKKKKERERNKKKIVEANREQEPM
jgi:hypothetical protein